MITEDGKILRCVEKFGLNKDESFRIVKSQDYMLNIKELGYKYGNDNIGAYPEWLDFNSHMAICIKTVDDAFNELFKCHYTKEDLIHSLYVWTMIRMNQYDNFAHLKCACVRALKNMQRDLVKHCRIDGFGQNIDLESAFNRSDFQGYLIDDAPNISFSDVDLINSLKSIENKQLKHLIVISGYLIGGIDELSSLYKDCLKELTDAEISKLRNLLSESEENSCGKPLKKGFITLGRIAKVLNIKSSVRNIKNELSRYMKCYQII